MCYIATVLGYCVLPAILGYTWFFVSVTVIGRMQEVALLPSTMFVLLAPSVTIGILTFFSVFFLKVFKPTRDECIYIFRREDGVYKIGYTNNLHRRQIEHQEDYNKKFTLVFHWDVSEVRVAERCALQLTSNHQYKEGNRLELRKMNRLQLLWFMYSFTYKISAAGLD